MDIGVEISLYPLTPEFVPAIREFLARLNAHAPLKVVTSSMSTQVFGPYDLVMDVLRRELQVSFEHAGRRGEKAVFVMKVLGPLPDA
jgi:uncharacterized protein YqgV (UPF0045/DUF77 family)